MNFGTQNKLNMLVTNILIGIDDLHPKFAKSGSKTETFPIFYEIWQSQQIEHANYEYDTRAIV